MQLVLPRQDDVRKYGFFFDSGQAIDFSSVSELRDLIRNSRASVQSQNENVIVTHPIMGIAAYGTGSRVYYSKLTIMSEPPNFTSDENFIRTLLVTGIKGGSGRKGSQMSLTDTFAGNTPFNGNNGSWVPSPFCLVPTKVGNVTVPTSYQVSFPDTTVQVSGASRQTGDSYRHRRRIYTATGYSEALTTPHSWSYNFTGTNMSSWALDAPGCMAFSMSAYVEMVYGGGYWRAGPITRRNALDANLFTPCSNQFGSSEQAESSISIDKFAIFIYEGLGIRAVVYNADDFSPRSANVGATLSLSMPEMPVIYNTDTIEL